MPTPYDPAALPAAVRTFLAAHPARDFAAMSAVVTDATVVVDEGREHVGRDAVRDWLTRAASEFSYTQEYRGQEQTGEREWTVLSHLEGDFPGGVVDLRFRFLVEGDTLARLTIAP